MLNNLKDMMNNKMDMLNAKVIVKKTIFDNNLEIAKKDVRKLMKKDNIQIAQGFKYEGKYKAKENK